MFIKVFSSFKSLQDATHGNYITSANIFNE